MTPSDIPKVGFARAYNRILTPTRTPLRTWTKNELEDFFKILMKIYSIHIAHILRVKVVRVWVWSVRVRVSEGEGEGEVKRVLSSSKVTSVRSCSSFLVLIFH